MEIGMAHETAVHKEELLGTLTLDIIQIGAESAYLYDRCLNLNRQQSLIHLTDKQIDYSLFYGRCRE